MPGDIAVDSISDYRVSGSIGSELRQGRRGEETSREAAEKREESNREKG